MCKCSKKVVVLIIIVLVIAGAYIFRNKLHDVMFPSEAARVAEQKEVNNKIDSLDKITASGSTGSESSAKN